MPEKQEFQLICVGGGPAGISLAIEAISMGMDPREILILEKGPCPIQAIRQFYPDKKMTLANYKNLPTETYGVLPTFPDLTKAETLDYFDELIQRYKLNYQLNAEVFKVEPTHSEMRVIVNQKTLLAKHVGVGIGILGRPNKPKYKIPVKIRKQVLFDLTSVPVTEGKILVVGGGDTSSEYCQILVQENCQVTLAYRSGEFTRMMDSNREAVDAMEKQGVLRVQRFCDIKELAESSGQVQVIYDDATKFPAETFDKVIYAIGGSTPVNFLKTIGIEFDENNWPKIGPDGETNIPRVYLIGDLAVGKQGGSIITAYNSSYRTAKRILQHEAQMEREAQSKG